MRVRRVMRALRRPWSSVSEKFVGLGVVLKAQYLNPKWREPKTPQISHNLVSLKMWLPLPRFMLIAFQGIEPSHPQMRVRSGAVTDHKEQSMAGFRKD